jgi:predicted molibdopterin-dependent oxidoreductase YjgC
VRVCKEQGTNVLDFMGRGVGAKVVTANDKPLQESGCTFCGSCVDVCPVNAILEADRWRKGREWEYEKEKSVCLSCGNSCDIIVSKKDGLVVKVNAGAQDGSVERYICAIGRFGFDSLISDSRLHSPMKREGNELKETTWDDALKLVAARLKKAGKKAGIVSTAGILNQDAIMLSRFASDVLKTDNIDTTASLYTDPDAMNSSDHIDIDAADLFILVGLNPSQWERVLPALDAGLRKRVARGAKLIVMNSGDTRISTIATLSIKDEEASSLAKVAKSLITKGAKPSREMESALSGVGTTEDSDKVADLLTEAKTPVIFCAPSFFNVSRNISLLAKVKVVAVPFEANARGVMAAGLTAKGKGYNDMISDGLEALYVIGDVPISKRPSVNFLVVQTSHLTDLAKQADVVLPAATYLESNGSIINYLGKVKRLTKVVKAPEGVKQHGDILVELSKAMGSPFKERITDLKPSAPPKPRFSPFEKRQGLDINPLELFESINTSVISSSRLLWLKETEKMMTV